MIAKELLDWFPDGKILDQPVAKEGYLSLPLSNYQWLLLEEASLSEREKQLVALLTKQEQTISLNPWYTYLIEGKGQAPQNFKKLQLVYCLLAEPLCTNIPCVSIVCRLKVNIVLIFSQRLLLFLIKPIDSTFFLHTAPPFVSLCLFNRSKTVKVFYEKRGCTSGFEAFGKSVCNFSNLYSSK